MNWMIDGLYGDLYRTAMGFPAHNAANDEWDIKRRSRNYGDVVDGAR